MEKGGGGGALDIYSLQLPPAGSQSVFPKKCPAMQIHVALNTVASDLVTC